MSTSVQNNQETVQNLSGGSGNEAIFNAELALGAVLAEGVQAQGIEASLEEAMSETLLQNDVANAQSITEQLEKQNKHHFWHKVLNITVDVAMGAFVLSQLADGDVAGAVLAGGMLAAKMTNGFSDAANGLAAGLQKAFPNMPPAEAHLISDVLIGVAVTVLSAGVGLAGEDEAVAEKGTESAAKKGTKEGEKEGEKAGKKGLSKTASSALMGGSVVTGELAPNLAFETTQAMGLSGESQKIVTGVLTAMLEIAAISGGSYAAFSSVGSVEKDTSIAVKATKVGIQGFEGALKAGQGTIDIEQGFTTMHLGDAESLQILNNALNLLNNAMIQKTEGKMDDIVTSLEGMLRNDDYFGGTEAVSQELG